MSRQHTLNLLLRDGDIAEVEVITTDPDDPEVFETIEYQVDDLEPSDVFGLIVRRTLDEMGIDEQEDDLPRGLITRGDGWTVPKCEYRTGHFTGELSCTVHGVYPECTETEED